LHVPNEIACGFDWAESEIAISNQIKVNDANGGQHLTTHFMT
jgi:hypothetical protein